MHTPLDQMSKYLAISEKKKPLVRMAWLSFATHNLVSEILLQRKPRDRALISLIYFNKIGF